MNNVLFSGPSLPPQQIGEIPGFCCLPPAAQGDIYRAALKRPHCIGIVDGYFQGTPAVWHKEILWAMQQGIHVYGSASMGALRAVELAPFGMRGVGRIFQAYQDGRLIDDDEVALIHGPVDSGYLCASEALVNIRFTLENAVQAEILTQLHSDRLIAQMKAIFYPGRSYPALLKHAAEFMTSGEVDELAHWFKSGTVDQKRADALAMIAEMHNAPDTPFFPAYQFEHTTSWDVFVVAAGEAGFIEEREAFAPLLTELRLDPARYQQLRQSALSELLRSGACGQEPNQAQFNAMAAQASDQLIGQSLLNPVLMRQLAASGGLPELEQRAAAKRQYIDRTYGSSPKFGDLMLTPEQLFNWFFQLRLQQPVPSDLEFCARQLGFQSLGSFCRALLDELVYTEGNSGS
ncbi:MAG: hypothetical protein KDI27_04565 [Gammaproteobacteria bacterium]|nr:hypothetical protein [Gammaproteobacteria bacterium]MCP5417498.1 hypothetical protein [Chromatiaceae bacterium]